MKKYIDLLDNIAKITYVPRKNRTNQESGDDFEFWVCENIVTKINYQIIDCTPNKSLSKLKQNYNVTYSTLNDLYPRDIIKDLRNKLNKIQQLEYPFDPGRKENLIIYQPWPGASPDILIVNGYNVLPIECKTSWRGLINFNDGIPKDGYRYMMAHLGRQIIKHSSGKNLEHPLKDEYLVKIHTKYVLEGEKFFKAELSKRMFNFDGILVKYGHRGRHQFKISKEIR